MKRSSFSALIASAIVTTALTVVFSGQLASAAATGGGFGGGARFSLGISPPLGGGGPALGGGGPAFGGGPIPGGGASFGNGTRLITNPNAVAGTAFGNAPPLIVNPRPVNSFNNTFFPFIGGGSSFVGSGFVSSGFAPGGFINSGFATPFLSQPFMTPIIPAQMLGSMQLQIDEPFAAQSVIGQRQMFINGMPQTVTGGAIVTNYSWPSRRSYGRTILSSGKKHSKRHHASSCTHHKR